MRCSCPECDTYMVQADDLTMGCVCPWCLHRCNACLGTNTVITREQLSQLKTTDWFTPNFESPISDEDDEA